MKVLGEEVRLYQQHFSQKGDQNRNAASLKLDFMQNSCLRAEVKKLRQFASQHSSLHHALELMPLFMLIFTWSLLMNWVAQAPAAVALKVISLGVVHGLLGYQWVIYTLHEGAGHGLLSGTPFRFFAKNASRLLFADPVYYAENHPYHHRYLGKPEDRSFTQYILPKRLLKSILPGAGVIYPNDFQVHDPMKWTPSKVQSFLVGGSFLFLEILWVGPSIGYLWALFSLVIIGPWIGMLLDRLRESTEHFLMPADPLFGTRQLGLNPLALLIGGGPWGQPVHVSHHVAPDLNWYAQIVLHFKMKKILYTHQKEALGMDDPIDIRFLWRVNQKRILMANQPISQKVTKKNDLEREKYASVQASV